MINCATMTLRSTRIGGECLTESGTRHRQCVGLRIFGGSNAIRSLVGTSSTDN